MENISENTQRRGRPRRVPDSIWARINQLEGTHTSHRHRANAIYGARTLHVLGDDPQFAWLTADRRGTIVKELGRLYDDQDLIALALYLCKHRPSSRQAVALLRAYRLDTRPLGTMQGLTHVLQQALATYLATHAPMARGAIKQALAAMDPHASITVLPEVPPARTRLERLVAAIDQQRARMQDTQAGGTL
jgi:hypothetical protein